MYSNTTSRKDYPFATQTEQPQGHHNYPLDTRHESTMEARSGAYYTNANPGPISDHRRRRRSLLICGLASILILIAIIVGVVLGLRAARNNAYPTYTRLSYTLSKEYAGSSFFNDFDYFHTYDPAQGWVHYADPDYAKTYNLTYASSAGAVLRVDTTDRNASTGRLSARLMTKQTWDKGLFVFDVAHSPFGCATWPALWLTDPANWPTNGEIDVMEAVNLADTGNQMALHTTKGCKMDRKRKQSGKTLHTDCHNTVDGNVGCGVQGAPATFGKAFNDNGGGVYAMELRAEGIRVWFFPRNSLPSDISSSSQTPDPSTWGEALADFPATDCDVNQHFRNQSIITNIDLCGQWAGLKDVFGAQCGTGTCENFVALNPSAFEQAYWQFNSWRVYTAS